MSTNDTQQQNTGTQQPQPSEEQLINTARKLLDNVKTGKQLLLAHNQMRKKVKRWFDKCAKKN